MSIFIFIFLSKFPKYYIFFGNKIISFGIQKNEKILTILMKYHEIF